MSCRPIPLSQEYEYFQLATDTLNWLIYHKAINETLVTGYPHRPYANWHNTESNVTAELQHLGSGWFAHVWKVKLSLEIAINTLVQIGFRTYRKSLLFVISCILRAHKITLCLTLSSSSIHTNFIGLKKMNLTCCRSLSAWGTILISSGISECFVQTWAVIGIGILSGLRSVTGLWSTF